MAEFVVNNKAYSATKMSLFIVNYNRELRMGVDIRRKEKVENMIEFTEKMKNMQEKAGVVSKKAQEKMKK